MKYLSPVFSILMIASISACGGGGGGDGGSQPVFQSISGVWDSSENSDGDIHYTVIRSDGSSSDYDYLGDSFDNVEDCYSKSDFTLIHDSGSRFIAFGEGDSDEGDALNLSVQDGRLRFEFDSGEIGTLAAAGLVEADLLPICE